MVANRPVVEPRYRSRTFGPACTSQHGAHAQGRQESAAGADAVVVDGLIAVLNCSLGCMPGGLVLCSSSDPFNGPDGIAGHGIPNPLSTQQSTEMHKMISGHRLGLSATSVLALSRPVNCLALVKFVMLV